MKIDLIKNHVLGKKGDTVSVSQPRGDYLVNRMGVAKKHVARAEAKKDEEEPKPKKVTKPRAKTKK